MKKVFKSLLVAFVCVVVIFSGKALAKEKVILDTDMVEAFDDGIAMLLLLKDPNIDLLGVCTITGNSWVEEGTAYTVKQLAIEGRLDVPIMKGLEYPLRASRHANFDMERKMFGMGHDGWVRLEFLVQHLGRQPINKDMVKHQRRLSKNSTQWILSLIPYARTPMRLL